ncbi:Flp pilus assembly complex ATPase component TadA [Vagococcus coleopterorum]|uniref:Flp pilus assembly complex ATPase component TadA n=1 Tax=Vagococcus coleopterorum TaxID=2714946 RepID=A0A6G8ALH5_9ENTE|nr:competence type IV pilus ATPase ComGA [Vagococcus coleopterorum]QIL45830.1 Flp pilus assembly complex ATPase component TadA [Vagococcus coleopterorum]
MEIKEQVSYYVELGIKTGASDMYLLPNEWGYTLSYRYGDLKRKQCRVSLGIGKRMLVYFKFLGDMNVGEGRLPQLGSTEFVLKEQSYFLRLSTVGDFKNRESLVVRFLQSFQGESSFQQFFPKKFSEMKNSMKKSGLYIFAGKTGTGKTTSMFNFAQSFSEEYQQVITVEDPVEIHYSEFLQLQVNEMIGATYEELLKLCLRHRPDTLIIGEIRDLKTAAAAIRAALTGHRVLTTVHGDTKQSIVQRLLELGINSNDLEQVLRGVIFQKLLPVKCPYCQDVCHVYCHHNSRGVIFNASFTNQIENQKNMADYHKKAWAYGFITTAVYQEQMALAGASET